MFNNDLGLGKLFTKSSIEGFFILQAKEDSDKYGDVLVEIPEKKIELYAKMISSRGVNIAAKEGDRLVCKFAEDCYSLFYIGNLGSKEDLANIDEINDLSKEFILQLGENLIYGKRDGSKFVIVTGDGQLEISHETGETDITVQGLLNIVADQIAMNKALAPVLNAMTQSQFTGAPLISQVPMITVG